MGGFLAFALPFALYCSLPSSMWNFDGVACAAALEYGDPTYFFHSQHLLYGLLGWLFWMPWTWVDPGVRALTALQIFTPLLSSLALVPVYSVLQRILHHHAKSALVMALLATSSVFWVWSVEPQVYPLGFLGLAWATFYILDSNPLNVRRVALWHALAVLGHAMHLLWIIPALYFLARRASEEHLARKAVIVEYLGLLLGTVGIAYLFVLGGVIAPSGKSSAWAMLWLKGSMGLTPDRTFAWHWGGWTGPLEWMWGFAKVFWGSLWPYGVQPGPLTWMLTALGGASVLGMIFLSFQKRGSPRVRFALLWLAAYGVLLSTWEPHTLCYRLPDVFPLGLLLAIGLTRLPDRWGLAAAGIAALSTSLVTFHARIQPMSDARLNRSYQDVIDYAKNTPEGTPFKTKNSLARLYAPYFTGRPAMIVP